jgi:ribosomal protein S18 acetylase RimI-like enzyme
MSFISIIEKTFFANCRYWGGLNSSLYNSGSIWAMKTGIESADLNMVWNEKPLTADDGRTIQDIKKHFRKAGLPFWWWVFPSAQSPATLDRLKAEDFSVVDRIPSLLADLTSIADGPQDAGLKILQIRDKEALLLWEEVSFSGFDFPPETRQQYHQFANTFNLSPDSPQKFYLACLNGRPVATSLLFLHENAGGIYFVSTRAEYRKKGIGLALTEATMRFARQAGVRYATLQSSPDGLRVYQQAGFKEYCQVDVYSPNTA